MIEAQLILAMVVQKFSLRLLPGHNVEPEPLLTLLPPGRALNDASPCKPDWDWARFTNTQKALVLFLRRPKKHLILVAIASTLIAIGLFVIFPRPGANYVLPEVDNLSLEAAGLGQLADIEKTAPRHPAPLTNPSLPRVPIVDPELAQVQYEAGIALAKVREPDKALSYLEAAAEAKPSSLRYGNDYRQVAINFHQYERSVKFWERLTSQADIPEVHLQLALAYVDLMATRPGLIGQGQLSIQSIGELDKVLQVRPHDWSARYARGLNHLYWPTGMHRLPLAVDDLLMALSIQRALPGGPRPFYVLTYVALGDAYAKNGQFDIAWTVWQDGLREFPSSSGLSERLQMTNPQLSSFVERERGLGVFITTDLSVLWMTPDS